VIALPDFVQIEPVGHCNLRCRMCPVQFRTDAPPAFMEYAAFTSLIDQFPAMKRLQLQGLGEPFMHPQFLQMVRYAASRGIEVSVNTNLTLITPRIARETIASGLAYLYGSIDGATPGTYEAIRLGANFAKVTRNLRRLLDARRDAGSASPLIALVYVLMRRNLAELPAFVELAGGWGVDTVNVQNLCHDFGESTLPPHYRPMREFVEEETILNEDPERVDAVFSAAKRIAERIGIELHLPNAQRNVMRKPGCSWPWNGAYFSFTGEAMPCCMVATPDRASMGNALDEGVQRLWDGERYSAFRDALESDTPPEICRTCAVYNGTF